MLTLTQKQLARILGGAEALSIATISLWEKPGSDRLPPPQRLETYARLFCTSRSFSGDRPRLLSSCDLTEQESELYHELVALRERPLCQAVDERPGAGQGAAQCDLALLGPDRGQHRLL
jgi:hypothetical protein